MKIKEESFRVPIYVTHFEGHAALKGQLLKIIDQVDVPRVDATGFNIARCSYGLPEINRQWTHMFFAALNDHLSAVYAELKTPGWEVQRAWFQTYTFGNTHRAHNHGGCTWANVYCLDVPNPAHATMFYHPARHWVELRACPQSDSVSVLQPEVREGDIVTFPGYVEHEAPIIDDQSRRTIISFNVNAGGAPQPTADWAAAHWQRGRPIASGP